MVYTQSGVLILYLVHLLYPVRSPWSAVRSPSFILTATFTPELIFEFKQSVLGLVEKRSMWRNVRTVGKSGGSCTFLGHKGETKFLNLLGAFYLNCLKDVKFHSFADFVHLPRVGQVVNSLCPSTEENSSSYLCYRDLSSSVNSWCQ